jgi:hypothetical protein
MDALPTYSNITLRNEEIDVTHSPFPSSPSLSPRKKKKRPQMPKNDRNQGASSSLPVLSLPPLFSSL